MFGHRYFGARFYGPRYWGDGGALPPPPPAITDVPGGSSKRRKKKGAVIRFADFESREAYELALAAALPASALPASALPATQIIESLHQPDDTEADDDDEIIRALILTRIIQ